MHLKMSLKKIKSLHWKFSFYQQIWIHPKTQIFAFFSKKTHQSFNFVRLIPNKINNEFFYLIWIWKMDEKNFQTLQPIKTESKSLFSQISTSNQKKLQNSEKFHQLSCFQKKLSDNFILNNRQKITYPRFLANLKKFQNSIHPFKIS